MILYMQVQNKIIGKGKGKEKKERKKKRKKM